MDHSPDARVGICGRNMRHLIGMHDIRREQFAGMIGISPTGLSNLLQGRSAPRLRTAVNAARAFGISLDDLHADTARCLRAAAVAYDHAPVRALGNGSSVGEAEASPTV